jgi:hypothetical protein
MDNGKIGKINRKGDFPLLPPLGPASRGPARPRPLPPPQPSRPLPWAGSQPRPSRLPSPPPLLGPGWRPSRGLPPPSPSWPSRPPRARRALLGQLSRRHRRHALWGVTPRILQLNFFLFFTRQNSGVTFPFLFPSLNLDLFQSSSGIRFGFPV